MLKYDVMNFTRWKSWGWTMVLIALSLSCRTSRNEKNFGDLSGMYLFSTEGCRPLLKILPRSATNPEDLSAPDLSIRMPDTDTPVSSVLAAGNPGKSGDVVWLRVCRQDTINCRETLLWQSGRVIPGLDPGINYFTAKTCVFNDRNIVKHGLFEVSLPEHAPGVLTCGKSSTQTSLLIPSSKESGPKNLLRNIYKARTAIHLHIYRLRGILLNYIQSDQTPPLYFGNQVHNLLNSREALHLYFLSKSFYQTISMTKELLKAFQALSSATPFSRGIMAPCASERETISLTQNRAYEEIRQTLKNYFSDSKKKRPENQKKSNTIESFRSFPTLAALSVLSMGGVASTSGRVRGTGYLYQDDPDFIRSGLSGFHMSVPAPLNPPSYVAGAGIGHTVSGAFRVLRNIYAADHRLNDPDDSRPEKILLNQLEEWSEDLLSLIHSYRLLVDRIPGLREF